MFHRTWLSMIACCAFLMAGCESRDKKPQALLEKTGGAHDKRDARADVWFFGTTADTVLGNLGWLIHFEDAYRQGELYVPPWMRKFAKVVVGDGGQVSFETEDVVGNTYIFEGSLNKGELTGEMRVADTKSRKVVSHTWRLAASELPAQREGQVAAGEVGPGRYYNVYYSDEGGDLVGVDIRLLATPKGMRGVMVFYDDSWGEPLFSPLALSGVAPIAKGIVFEFDAVDGRARYHLRNTPKGALFDREGRSNGGQVLKRSRAVLSTSLAK